MHDSAAKWLRLHQPPREVLRWRRRVAATEPGRFLSLTAPHEILLSGDKGIPPKLKQKLKRSRDRYYATPEGYEVGELLARGLIAGEIGVYSGVVLLEG